MKNIIGPIIMIIFIYTSCSDDYEPISVNTVGISVSFPEFCTGIDSRTTMNGSKASFTTGDKIGISETLTGKYNASYTYGSPLWTTATPLYWYNGTSTHSFYAYYPYNSSSQQLLAAMPVLSGQTVSTVPDATCDMLVTPTPATLVRNTSSPVTLTMSHAFALLRFDIKMGIIIINTYRLDSLVITGGNTGGSNPYGMFNTVNNIPSVRFNLSANWVQLVTNDKTTCTQVLRSTPSAVSLLATTTSIYALVLPGSYTNPAPAIKISVSNLGILSSTKYLTLPNASSFAAGKMYTYQVTVGLPLRSTSADAMCTGEQNILPALIESYVP